MYLVTNCSAQSGTASDARRGTPRCVFLLCRSALDRNEIKVKKRKEIEMWDEKKNLIEMHRSHVKAIEYSKQRRGLKISLTTLRFRQ